MKEQPDLPPPGRRPLRGDEAELYARLGDRLEREVARNVNTSRENVEDACTFAWEQLHRYQPERWGVFPYLRVTAIREAIRLDRIDRGHLSLDKASRDDEARLDNLPTPPPEEERSDLLEQALEAVRSLPPRKGFVLLARGMGYSAEETAAMMGASAKMVTLLYRRGRDRIADREAAELAREYGRLPEAPLVSHAKQLRARPPRYLREALGRVPRARDCPGGRLWWLRGAIAIERYRLSENVTDERRALGRRPPNGDPRRERWETARRAVAIARDHLGFDRGWER